MIIISILIILQLIPNKLPENQGVTNNDLIIAEQPPDEVKLILKKACYDCHSNQSVYPWYSYVAPASWLIAKDVREGREELNLSDWADQSKRRKIKIMNEMAEEIEKEKMPLDIYVVVHRDAILTEEEIETITSWTKSVSDKILGD